MRTFAVRSPLSLIAVLAVVALGLGITACAAGDVPVEGTTYIDDDGDGVTDGVYTDGDGEIDFTIPGCDTCAPDAKAVCRVPLIDENRDGIADGLDTNCDGRIDIRFGAGGGGGGQPGQGGRCIANSTVNGVKFGVSCVGAPGGGSATCECRRNDQLVQTCTQAATVCSLSVRNGRVSAGCCQF